MKKISIEMCIFLREFLPNIGLTSLGPVSMLIFSYVGNIDAVLNYPLFWGIRNVFLYGQSFHTLHNSLDDIHNSFSTNSLDILGTFLDNHDNPRFLNQKNNINSLKNALAFLYGTRGI